MARFLTVVFAVAMLYSVLCKPLDSENSEVGQQLELSVAGAPAPHRLQRRFIDPGLAYGDFSESGHTNMRTKRSTEEECEKLSLCKLHARSYRNFFAAYELYFVNKENARLWDHRARSLADCQAQYSGCYH